MAAVAPSNGSSADVRMPSCAWRRLNIWQEFVLININCFFVTCCYIWLVVLLFSLCSWRSLRNPSRDPPELGRQFWTSPRRSQAPDRGVVCEDLCGNQCGFVCLLWMYVFVVFPFIHLNIAFMWCSCCCGQQTWLFYPEDHVVAAGALRKVFSERAVPEVPAVVAAASLDWGPRPSVLLLFAVICFMMYVSCFFMFMFYCMFMFVCLFNCCQFASCLHLL